MLNKLKKTILLLVLTGITSQFVCAQRVKKSAGYFKSSSVVGLLVFANKIELQYYPLNSKFRRFTLNAIEGHIWDK